MNEIVDDNPGDVSNYPAPMTGTPRLIKFLRTALQNPEHEDLFQEVLNIGYNEWQRPENEQTWGFADMVSWVRENFGDDAALITMLGKFNQQVCNGGIIQWLDNGYASDDSKRNRRRRSYGASPSMDLSLLEWMIEDLDESSLRNLPHGKDIYDILTSIQNEISDASGECYSCHNHRYVKCEDCDGSGEDESGEGECEECHGEGEVPCQDCNEDGQLEMDAEEGSLNNIYFDRLESKYYKINETWEKEVTDYLKTLVRSSQGGGLLSRAQAFKATENILAMLDRLIEATEPDMNQFPKPSLHWEDMSPLLELLFGGIPDISEDVFEFWNNDGEVDKVLAVLNSGYDVAKELLASPDFYKFMTSRLNSYKAALLKIKNKYPSER